MLWVTETTTNRIARVSPSTLSIREFAVPTANSVPWGITASADGNMYFSESGVGKVGRITTSGSITEIGLPNSGSRPVGIASDAYGNIWVAEYGCNRVAEICSDNSIMEYLTPTSNSRTNGLIVQSDNAVWSTEAVGNRLFRVAGETGAQVVQPDPITSSTETVGTVGGDVVSQNGDNQTLVNLLTRCNCNCGQDASAGLGGSIDLTANSSSVNVKPVIAAQFASDSLGAVPTQIQVQLTWNNGTPQPWVTFQTTGHSPGDVYQLNVQASTAVTTTGVYPWTLEIKATLPGGDVIDRKCSGQAPVFVSSFRQLDRAGLDHRRRGSTGLHQHRSLLHLRLGRGSLLPHRRRSYLPQSAQ